MSQQPPPSSPPPGFRPPPPPGFRPPPPPYAGLPPRPRTEVTWIGYVVGAPLAVLSLVITWVVNDPDHLRSPGWGRIGPWLGALPLLLLALVVLVVGLVAARYWQAAVGAVLAALAGLVPAYVTRHIAQWAYDHHWAMSDVSTVLAWIGGIALVVSVAAWSLVRRHHPLWLLGLVGAAVAAIIAHFLGNAVADSADSFDDVRRITVETDAITLLATLAGVWCCVLADRLAPRVPGVVKR